ncbi:hypothetical protein HDU98_010487 [Podochytrium sp. JEL0797]|nr:hypothetical protein HDU98_010487 [Podochytrium sp. JEL0797]
MFFSFNVPNLHLIEDAVYNTSSHWRIPNTFEQTDALSALQQLGPLGNVTRIYTLAIQDPVNNPTMPYHIGTASTTPPDSNWILIPGTKNPALVANRALFEALDSAMALASTHGIQVIIPFIDQYQWWGGIPAFCRLHNQPASIFYTNEPILANFLQVVSFVTTRNNTISGVPYRSDPAVYAWETGNELGQPGSPVPSTWTHSVSRLLKNEIKVSQLVVDGSYSLYGWDPLSFNESTIDAFTGHYYQLPLTERDEIAIGVGGAFWVGSVVVGVGLLVWIRYQPTRFGLSPRSETKPLVHSLHEMVSLRADRVELSEDPPPPSKRNFRKLTTLIILSLLLLTFLASLIANILTATRLLHPPTYATRFQSDYTLITSHSKLFFVGEFGLASPQEFHGLLSAVAATNALGALIWSLRFRSRYDGFYNHRELQGYESYHFPGFGVYGGDQVEVVDLMRSFAGGSRGGEMEGLQAPRIAPVLLTPLVVVGGKSVQLKWRGSAGARNYTVERCVRGFEICSSGDNTGFHVVAEGVSDAVVEGSVLVEDSVAGGVAVANGTVWYRVVGVNEGGGGVYSGVVNVTVGN